MENNNDFDKERINYLIEIKNKDIPVELKIVDEFELKIIEMCDKMIRDATYKLNMIHADDDDCRWVVTNPVGLTPPSIYLNIISPAMEKEMLRKEIEEMHKSRGYLLELMKRSRPQPPPPSLYDQVWSYIYNAFK